MNDVLIRRVKGMVFDVFFGNGFDNWSRVRKTPRGVFVLQGYRRDSDQLKFLEAKLKNY